MKEGDTGFLATPFDPRSLADAIKRSLQDSFNNPETRQRCREHIQNHFTVQMMVDKYETLFRSRTTDK